MKRTLLQLVQRTLSAIDSEDVNSVSDTNESAMVANIANRAFEEMATTVRWRHFRTLTTLTAGATLNQLVLPSNTYDMNGRIYYEGQPVFYKDPEAFLQMTILRNTAESNITTYDNIRAYNDRNPSYFTSFDDEKLVFDAVPSSMSGLDGTDCLAIVYIYPTNELTTDGQYFDLPSIAFPALQDLIISHAHNELKGDTEAANLMMGRHRAKMSNIRKNMRVVDREDDVRSHIIPRPTRRAIPYFYTIGS